MTALCTRRPEDSLQPNRPVKKVRGGCRLVRLYQVSELLYDFRGLSSTGTVMISFSVKYLDGLGDMSCFFPHGLSSGDPDLHYL